MTMKKITVEIRQVYGLKKVYPADETAKLFARIAGQVTLTDHTVEMVKALGYKVQVQVPTL